MGDSNGNIFLGCVEQAICGGADPLFPAISVSCNGTLAKWREKFQILDLRVNDPGLRQYRKKVEDLLIQAKSLDIDVILTLPEVNTALLDPPPPPPVREVSSVRPSSFAPRIAEKKPAEYGKVSAFQTCLLAIPRTVPSAKIYHLLTVEECFPVLDLAEKHGVKRVIVPASEPGLFLDPQAGAEYHTAVVKLAAYARERGIALSLKNGGLPPDIFLRLHRETGCTLAYNIGTAYLERQEVLAFYQKYQDKISVLLMHQVLPGMDKYAIWKDENVKAVRIYRLAQRHFNAADRSHNAEARRATIAALLDAYYAWMDARRNTSFNLGLFQSGEINFLPLLKIIQKELRQGKDKSLILETIPSVKNAEFLRRHLLSESFSVSL
ncbi:MAG: hypothetical protein HQM09_09230 [Candidatus Riflebacteria bacterium]|nr:hypothetical protein [Candidatus Riflebacteria bacterium]